MKLNAYLLTIGNAKASDLYNLSPDELAKAVHLTKHDFSKDKGWTLVGHAEAQITLLPPADIVSGQVATLRAQVQQTMADAQQRVTQLERQINSLLAIEDCTSETREVQP